MCSCALLLLLEFISKIGIVFCCCCFIFFTSESFHSAFTCCQVSTGACGGGNTATGHQTHEQRDPGLPGE